MEVTYVASLLKKKALTYNNESMLAEVAEKGKRTLELLTQNMISGEVPLSRIIEHYKVVKRENVIKLLLRCRNMYTARHDIKRILNLLLQKDV